MNLVNKVGLIIGSLSLLVIVVHGYSTGAGSGSCMTLLPSHDGFTTQTTPSLFSVTTVKTSYTANEQVEVTLKSLCTGTPIKGFLIQARRADNIVDRTVAIGTFTAVPSTKQLCTGNKALTHSQALNTEELKIMWTAPATLEGNIVFKVTFVEAKATFWQGVTSKPLSAANSAIVNADSTETTVVNSGDCPVSAVFTANPLCGGTLGCYSDCTTDSCSFEITWNFNGNGPNADFTFKASTTVTSSPYVAIGLSADAKMGGDSVIECVIASDGSAQVYNSFNTGRSNNRNTAKPQLGITGVTGSLANGIMECSFTRTKQVSGDANVYNLDSNYKMLFAMGTASDSKVGKHSKTPVVSTEVVDFAAFKSYSAAAASKTLVQAHGSLMVIAWVLAASIGLVAARYFKPIWPTSSFMGQKIWFQIHRTSMIVVFTATCLAFILIFVDVQDWTTSEETVQNAHPYLGLIVTILCIVNPIMAIFRPHPGTEKRVIFNWVHWGVGTVAFVLGLITVTIGTRMSRAQITDSAVWVVVGFIVWQMLVVLCLELVQLLANKDSIKNISKDSYELQQKTGEFQPDAQPPPPADPPAATLKIAIFVVHAVVVLVFTIVLIVMIAM